MKAVVKNKKAVAWVVVICSLLVVAVVVYYILARRSASKSNIIQALPTDSANTVLKYGSRGEDVKTLQRWLNAKIVFFFDERGGRPVYQNTTLHSLTVDGIFGAKTQAAVTWWFGKDSVTLKELV